MHGEWRTVSCLWCCRPCAASVAQTRFKVVSPVCTMQPQLLSLMLNAENFHLLGSPVAADPMQIPSRVQTWFKVVSAPAAPVAMTQRLMVDEEQFRLPRAQEPVLLQLLCCQPCWDLVQG